MTSLIVAAILYPHKIPYLDVVYSCQYYFKDRRTSYDQIYLVHHNGKGRKQITFGKKTSYSPVFLDGDHVAYLEYDGRDVVYEANKTILSLVVYKLSTGARKTIRKFKPTNIIERAKIESSGDSIEIDGAYFRVKPDGLTQINKVEIEPTYWGVEVNHFEGKSVVDYKGSVPTRIGKFDVAYTWADHEDPEKASFMTDISLDGKTQSVNLKGGEIKSTFSGPGSQFYIKTSVWYSRGRTLDHLYSYDWKTNSARVVADDVSNLEFSLNHEFWFGGRTSAEEIVEIDHGKWIWVNSFYIGEVATGKKWKIADGLVSVGQYDHYPR